MKKRDRERQMVEVLKSLRDYFERQPVLTEEEYALLEQVEAVLGRQKGKGDERQTH